MSVRQARAEPASVGQRLLFVMDRYRGGRRSMGVPLLFRLRGELDEQALATAVSGLVSRHEALRTTFGMHGRVLYQFVHEPEQIQTPHSVADLRAVSEPWLTAQSQASLFLREDPDPARSPVATALWRTSQDEYLFAVNIHHMVTDAWSNALAARDLSVLYSAAVGGVPADLPEVTWQQSDHIRWQEEHLTGATLARHQEYWREQLRDVAFTRLPDPREKIDVAARRGAAMAQEWFALSPELVSALDQAAARRGGTVPSLLTAAMLAALREVTGQPDLAIGSILANRSRPEIAQTIGFFANMVVVRDRDPGGTITSGQLADRVHQTMREALEHEELPMLLVPLAGDADPARRRGRPEDVVFHMFGVPPDAGPDAVCFAGLDAEHLRVPDGAGSRFDFQVLVIPRRQGFDGVVRYLPDRFDQGYARRFVHHYTAAAESLAAGT